MRILLNSPGQTHFAADDKSTHNRFILTFIQPCFVKYLKRYSPVVYIPLIFLIC